MAPGSSLLSHGAPEIVRAPLKALEDRGVDTDHFNRLALDNALADDVAARLRSEQSGQFSIEQVESEYSYPADYEAMPVDRQIESMKTCFPGLDVEAALKFARTELPNRALPAGAEAWFVIPRWQMIATDYQRAAERMLAVLAGTRNLHRYDGSSPMERTLRPEAERADVWEQLCATQSCDILIVPAQFGLRHAGRSMRRARELYAKNEFGLGLFATAAMLLTHPRRLTSYYSLFLQCPGDEYADTHGDFVQAPSFGFSYGADGKMLFYPRWTLATHEEYGSATGFISSGTT